MTRDELEAYFIETNPAEIEHRKLRLGIAEARRRNKAGWPAPDGAKWWTRTNLLASGWVPKC